MKQGYYEISKDYLSSLLVKRGMSFRDLAKVADINVSTVSRIMSGKIQRVSADTVKRIAEALGIDSNDLLISRKSIDTDYSSAVSNVNTYLARDLEALNWENFISGNIRALLINAYIAGYNRGVAKAKRISGENK